MNKRYGEYEQVNGATVNRAIMERDQLAEKMEEFERSGYILAMRLLQSDLDFDDVEMGAIAQFTQPEVMLRVLRAMK